jgi:acyl carrier protein
LAHDEARCSPSMSRFEQAGMAVLTAGSGMAALHALLLGGSSCPAQIVVAPFLWPRLLAPGKRAAQFGFFAEFLPGAGTNDPAPADAHVAHHAQLLLVRPAHEGQPDSRLSEAAALAVVQRVVRDVMGTAPADDQPLMEAGLDSLGAADVRAKLSAAFGVTLPGTAVFDHPSVSALAKLIVLLHWPLPLATSANFPPASAKVRKLVQPPSALTLREVAAKVQRIVEGLIGTSVPADQPLMEAGLDSLGVVELQRRLSEVHCMPWRLSETFNPTVPL